MAISSRDSVPLTQARANLVETTEQVEAGSGPLTTKHHGSEMARMRDRMDLLLIDDARRGLGDIAAGRTTEADAAIERLRRRRAAAAR